MIAPGAEAVMGLVNSLFRRWSQAVMSVRPDEGAYLASSSEEVPIDVQGNAPLIQPLLRRPAYRRVSLPHNRL